jgi:hypothetical protein
MVVCAALWVFNSHLLTALAYDAEAISTTVTRVGQSLQKDHTSERGHGPELWPLGLSTAIALLQVGLVFSKVALEPHCGAVVFESQDVSGDAIKEEAIVRDHECTARKAHDCLLKGTQCPCSSTSTGRVQGRVQRQGAVHQMSTHMVDCAAALARPRSAISKRGIAFVSSTVPHRQQCHISEACATANHQCEFFGALPQRMRAHACICSTWRTSDASSTLTLI